MTADLGEFVSTDLGPFIAVIDDHVAAIVAECRPLARLAPLGTPPGTRALFTFARPVPEQGRAAAAHSTFGPYPHQWDAKDAFQRVYGYWPDDAVREIPYTREMGPR